MLVSQDNPAMFRTCFNQRPFGRIITLRLVLALTLLFNLPSARSELLFYDGFICYMREG